MVDYYADVLYYFQHEYFWKLSMLAFIEYYNVQVYKYEADQLMELLKLTTYAFVDAVFIHTLLGKLTVISGATLSKEYVWVIDWSKIYKTLVYASEYQ